MDFFDGESILYVLLLLSVWFIPGTRGSSGLLWAIAFVVLDGLFAHFSTLHPAIVSSLTAVALLLIHFISSEFWEDPFSYASLSRITGRWTIVAGKLLSGIGIKPEAVILDYRDYRQLRIVTRMLGANRWQEAEDYLGKLSFSERSQVIEGITDEPHKPAVFEQWLEAQPDCALATLCAAQLYLKAAWQLRGESSADTVTRDAMEDFAWYLNESRDYFTKAIALDDRYAESWVGLIAIAMGSGERRSELYDYFTRAVALSDGHYEVYVAMINALGEKWGGEPAEAIALAGEALHECKANSPLAGVVAVAHIERWLYLLLCDRTAEAADYFCQPDIVAELNRAWSILSGSQLESLDHVQALNALAFCFYVGDQYVAAQQVIEQLNGKYVVYPWQYCSEPMLSTIDPGFAIDLVVKRLQSIPAAMQA